MDNTIGQNVRKHRERLAWTQEVLATAASVDPRTVQRIERGQPASADSLLGIASALNVDIEELRRAPVDEAEAAKALKVLEAKYRIIHLVRIERASTLSQFFSGSDAVLFERVGLENDAEEDVAAELEGVLRDGVDVWVDTPASLRRDVEKDIQRMVEALLALGLVVTAGTDTRRMRFGDGKGEPFDLTTLYVLLSRADKPKLFILSEKNSKVQFA